MEIYIRDTLRHFGHLIISHHMFWRPCALNYILKYLVDQTVYLKTHFWTSQYVLRDPTPIFFRIFETPHTMYLYILGLATANSINK